MVMVLVRGTDNVDTADNGSSASSFSALTDILYHIITDDGLSV